MPSKTTTKKDTYRSTVNEQRKTYREHTNQKRAE